MKLFILGVLSVSTITTLFAGGGPNTGGGGGGGTAPPGTAEVRTLSERVPAGGTVQVKHLFTQPVPITSGGTSFLLDGFTVDGVSLFSPLGDTAGAAVIQNQMLCIYAVSPGSDFGTNLDYPFLTVTMDIPASTPAGSTISLGLIGNSVFQTPTGSLTLTDPKPGTLTIAGSLSVNGVFPGGGTWPAGTVISVRGKGFQPGTRLSAKMKIANVVYVSPSEMRFTLQDSAALDTQPIQVVNPDGSQVTFYSYLRGVPVQPPSRALLQQTEPIFPTLTHALATVGPLPSMGVGDYVALAVQNPNTGPVVVTFQLQSTGKATSVLLPSGGRILDDVSALLGGATIGSGDVITVTATAGVEMFGLYANDSGRKVTPFVPTF